MLTLALRSSLVLSVAALLTAVWMPLGPTPVSGGAPFSAVLEELRGASTLHMQLEKAGQTSEILVRAPGLVRKQDSPQRYQIASGSRWWKIDETENTVVEGNSPWFLSPDRQVDLLGLLDVGVQDASPLLVAKPFQRTTFGGRDCFAYRVDVPAQRGKLQIEAFADASNRQLVGIIARDPAIANALPLAELRLVALNQAVADEEFVVAKSLTEDGRIGKVSESQGIVVLRPMLARRWTPVCRETLLKPGDWLRTELRGANAVKVTLSSGVVLTLGPGTQMECISPTQARLHGGQVQVQLAAAKDDKSSVEFRLLAPREGSRLFKSGSTQLVRVDRDEKIVDVRQKPVWLAGFEGTSNNESLGSLIVNLPDGRNEPLSVGYHKVSVEIRDQIARTTIEESFVNHTPARLEGVFHFPLPHDASISGFGMWIGNDLVEADVVEKQRAREIFEAILREKKDPGLLEWMGGNIFKARVFPIEGHSEKRIKIVYTQVLPLRANRYRYSYGLRSEMLRTKPLRELSVSVTVNSALPLKGISCPTHTARTLQTEHSAQVDFAAQEYTPTRDFELVCEVDGKQSDVVVIPHRRGSDGYFMIQLSPPGADGNWQREILPDGKPLNVVLLCDTSSSMDGEKRKQQSEFVGTVLTSLGDDDRFQLVCADVGTAWHSATPLSPSADNIAKARAFLDERLSLGWTNLDRAFADVIQKAPADAQVIYIGDGIVSSGSTDAAAFVQRLKQLVASSPAAKDSGRTFQAVAVGNSTEPVVLKGIARLAGGSVRGIGNEQSPQVVALELLNEIAQPGLRDLNVEFRGVKVAAVYPEQLPNVSAGTQQILVGRYLPEGKDQTGEIIVTGMRGSEKVRFAARINLKDAEEGNSFIPRLWARSHLDLLMSQGQNSAIRDEIIGLSEQFHIITPYTSLLVLESDADRERYGVQRRYEMRDGERFFAEGRNNANFELVKAQMKRAGEWRTQMRRKILAGLKPLGRDAQALQQQLQIMQHVYSRDLGVMSYGSFMGRSGGRLYGFAGGSGGGFGAFGGAEANSLMGFDSSFLGNMNGFDSFSALSEPAAVPAPLGDVDELRETEAGLSLGVAEGGEDDSKMDFEERGVLADAIGGLNGRRVAGLKAAFDSDKYAEFGKRAFISDRRSKDQYGYWNRYNPTPDYTSWLNTLFPALPRAATPAKEPVDTQTWSAEALAVSRTLLRIESLKKLDGGLELQRTTDQFDPTWKRRSSHSRDLVLYSPAAWLTRSLNLNDQTLVNYGNAHERGVFSLAFLLGRKRPSVPTDFGPDHLGLQDGSVTPLHQQYREYDARIENAGQDRVNLVLSPKDSTHVEIYSIDTSRHVVLKREWQSDGKITSSMTYDDFVELAGSWWARKISHLNGDGQKTTETTLDIKSIEMAEFSKRTDAELAAKGSVQFIQLPFVSLAVARQKTADGAATFDHRLAMILRNAQLQQWDEMWKHVDAVEQLAADKPGIRWIRTILQATIRRNEEARQRLSLEAKNLAMMARQDEVFLAEFILGQAQPLTSWPEFLEIVQAAKPVYERQPADLDVMPQWTQRLAQCYESTGRMKEALPLRRSLAEAAPWHVHWQTEYAQRLSSTGEFDAAIAWLQQQIDRSEKRPDYDDEALRTAVTNIYRSQGRWSDLLKFTTNWIGTNPESMSYNAAYPQHLSALVFNDQVDHANALAQQWMTESQIDGKLSLAQRARLEGAMNFALGNSYNLSMQRMDERWYKPLGELVRFFIRHPHHSDVASRVMTHYYFQQSDVADRLRGEFLTTLQTDLAKLSPAQVNTLVSWTLSGRMALPQPQNGRVQLDASEIPAEVWRKIATELKARWVATTDRNEKNLIADSLSSIYANRFREELYIPFLRERIAAAHPDDRLRQIAALFDALLSAKWTAQIEQEAFDRLHDLSDSKDPVDRLTVQLPALYRLVDAMLSSRQTALELVFNDQGGQDKLTRKELATKKAEMIREAREQLSAHLADEAKKEDGPLADWLNIERTWLEVQLNRDLPAVVQFCWKVLGDAPPKPQADDDPVVTVVDPDPAAPARDADANKEFLQSILKQRALDTAMNLAVRRSAKPDAVARLMKFIDEGIAAETKPADQTVAGERGNNGVWRNVKFRFLVALDRPDDLDRELRQWIRDDVSTAPWRQMLARLLAERGKFDEAIPLLEACEKDKLLSAQDYRLLADWYLVVDRRAAYERTRIEAYKLAPEGQLNQMLYAISNRWQSQTATKTEVDDETLFALKALFEKSAVPQNYLWAIRNIYAASRDFRLLQILPDSITGRSPQQVYDYLTQINRQVVYEVRNEATADEILARVTALRSGQLTPTDLRALDLLEALVERKSSDLLNQPGPHLQASLAALRRAFERKWGDGELPMMAGFLSDLGELKAPLADEQLRELRELQKLAAPKSRDHLTITSHLCMLDGGTYGRLDQAIQMMQSEVRDYTQTHGGALPHQDDSILSNYLFLHERANRHATAETILKGFQERPENDEQRKWMSDRMSAIYNSAFEVDGAVSIGSGRASLLPAIYKLSLKQLDQSADENERFNLISRVVSMFDIAQRNKVAGGPELVRNFGFDVMPGLLKRQTGQYRNSVYAPIRVISDLAGPADALRYIVERMEQYPQRLEMSWENSWQTLGSELAHRRMDVSDDLNSRILKLAIRELKRELRTGESRNQYIYHRSYQQFWAAKADDFAKAAEEVLADNKTSGRLAMAVSQYLWHGLNRVDRAIEILFVAHKQGLLDEGAQSQLAQWLHELNRFGESIPILESLSAARVENINYRTRLMTAYFRTQRPQQFSDLLQQTHDFFHAKGRWNEGAAAALGQVCYECRQPERAIAYLTEAIALHQRAYPGSGLNNGTLAHYYSMLAYSNSELGRTREAVDAASAAIVCWGATRVERNNQLETLKGVLRSAKDLDAYVKFLDDETAKTGQDSPILRKEIGLIYQEKKELDKAIVQLKLAVELQPHDAAIHQALMACYDATGKSDAATAQLLKLIDLHRHDLALYRQLADRLKGNEVEAERAATSIIEASPNEAENHAAMAELRQSQNRWDEAIPHWEQVAELRKLEPNGLLKLAEAQLHEKQWNAARSTVNKLRKTDWPPRFTDVQNQATQLEMRIPKE